MYLIFIIDLSVHEQVLQGKYCSNVVNLVFWAYQRVIKAGVRKSVGKKAQRKQHF